MGVARLFFSGLRLSIEVLQSIEAALESLDASIEYTSMGLPLRNMNGEYSIRVYRLDLEPQIEEALLRHNATPGRVEMG
jgi:hypothetical protein